MPFGVITSVALLMNLLIVVAVMSPAVLLSSTLSPYSSVPSTLPCTDCALMLPLLVLLVGICALAMLVPAAVERLEEWAQSTASPDIIAAVEFIRAKNVFSCMRDLHRPDCEIPRDQRLAVAKRYRVQVPSVRVRGLGAGRRLLSSAYNLLGYRTMYRVTGLVGGLR